MKLFELNYEWDNEQKHRDCILWFKNAKWKMKSNEINDILNLKPSDMLLYRETKRIEKCQKNIISLI